MNTLPNSDEPSGGMTLRDFFAAQIINGVISINGVKQTKPVADLADQLAECAYRTADAMLRCRLRDFRGPNGPEYYWKDVGRDGHPQNLRLCKHCASALDGWAIKYGEWSSGTLTNTKAGINCTVCAKQIIGVNQ